MPGPLANVGTTITAINLDVSRMLNWGPNIVLNFLIPDATEQNTGLRLIRSIAKGFDRIAGDEMTRGEGHTVILQVADKTGDLLPILRSKDLHVEVGGETFTVGPVPPVAPNEAQVYTLTCKTRTLRGRFDTTK